MTELEQIDAIARTIDEAWEHEDRWPHAMALALAAWRETHLAELADLIDYLSPFTPEVVDQMPLPDEPQLSWDARRMMNVARRDDPRTAAALVDFCERMPISFPRSYGQLHPTPHLDRLFDAIAKAPAIADRRHRARLAAMRDRPSSRSHGGRKFQVQVATEALAAIDARATDETLAARVRELLVETFFWKGSTVSQAPAIATFSPDELWLRVAADPDDDHARHVLGDALLDRGDLRGMLFALQLDGSKAQRGRSLVKAHWTTWLGESLARLALKRHSHYERGMIDVLRIGPGSTPSWVFDDAINHRELLCVRTVHMNLVNPPDYGRLVASLPNVQCADIDSLAIAHALEDAGALDRLQRIELRVGRGYDGLDALVELLAGASALREIRIDRSFARLDYLDALVAGLPSITFDVPVTDELRTRYTSVPQIRFRES